METECDHCALKFQREPGFFLGSIYFNYGLTGLIVAIAYPILLFGYRLPETQLLMGGLTFSVIFPMLFFRWARSLWLGFDQFIDPREAKEE